MKYRLKLYLAFVGVALISAVLALTIVYKTTQQQLFVQMRTKVASIAATAAVLIDPELLKTIHTERDLNSPNYIASQKQLRKITDANQREDVYVRYAYTVYPSPWDPTQLVFGVDSAELPETPGEIYNYSDAKEILDHLNEPYADQEFSKGPWGIWLSGFAPITDNQGNYVATLELDVDVQSVLDAFHRLILFGLFSLLAALILAIVLAYWLASAATRSLATLNATVKEIGSGNLKSESHLETHDEFEDLGEAINDMAKGLQERERLKMNFARYVSQYVLEKILQSDTPTKLEGENKKVTALVADIRQFTLLSEKLAPEQVVSLLNQYFEKMLDVIFRNYGTLDKFMGDGILVEFGAPLEDVNQEKNALTCALQMQEALKALCDTWEKEGKPRIQIGIGIHTGKAIVGNIGSEQRMEYTAIGNTINVAYRLEQATKTYNKSILASETTVGPVETLFVVENLGPVVLPERTEKITVYAIISAVSSDKKRGR
jgi:adenylate cyclase